MSNSKPPSHVVREIACESDTHPATVAKYLEGRPVRPLCAKRIARALLSRGWNGVEDAAAGVTPEKGG